MTIKELAFISSHKEDDVNELLLHARQYPDIDMKVAAQQIQGWQTAKRKIPQWSATEGMLFPPHLSLEQCSSEQTAGYKAQLALHSLEEWKDKMESCYAESVPFADLTGGFGVDAVTIAAALPSAMLSFVEVNPELCACARHNFPLLGVERFEVFNKPCQEVLDTLPHQFLIFIDPARRDLQGRKTVALSDCTPDITTLQQQMMEKAEVVMVKLSPMLDLSEARRSLEGLREIHVVSVGGECKEVLLLLDREWGSDADVRVKCVNIKSGGTDSFNLLWNESQTAEAEYAEALGGWLYEPNASVMKAGAYKLVGRRFGLKKLSANSHLYTSDTLVEGFPGRTFKLDSTYTMSKKDVRRLKERTSKANITVRNFPLKVDELRKRLKISEGGNDYLFATTLANQSHLLLLCRKAGED